VICPTHLTVISSHRTRRETSKRQNRSTAEAGEAHHGSARRHLRGARWPHTERPWTPAAHPRGRGGPHLRPLRPPPGRRQGPHGGARRPPSGSSHPRGGGGPYGGLQRRHGRPDDGCPKRMTSGAAMDPLLLRNHARILRGHCPRWRSISQGAARQLRKRKSRSKP